MKVRNHPCCQKVEGKTATIKCASCSKTFTRYISTIKNAISKGATKTLFCSVVCRARYSKIKQKENKQIANERRVIPFVSKPLNKTTAKEKRDVGKCLLYGISAEYLVCSHIINLGYNAFLTNQFCSYDVVVDYKGKLLKVQVKSTTEMRKFNQGYEAYLFWTKKRGRRQTKYYDKGDYDLLALVALDIGIIAYLPYSAATHNSLQLLPPGYSSYKSRRKTIDKYPFNRAVNSI